MPVSAGVRLTLVVLFPCWTPRADSFQVGEHTLTHAGNVSHSNHDLLDEHRRRKQ